MARHTAWAHSLWNDMEEDDDSDTDSRLSGSVAVDSVMRRMHQKQNNRMFPPSEDGGMGAVGGVRSNEFTLDSGNHEETDGGGGDGGLSSSQNTTTTSGSSNAMVRSNGYKTGTSPSQGRRVTVGGPMGISPKSNSRSMGGYVNVRIGQGHPGSRRNDHILSPVPENMAGRLMNSSASDVGVVVSNQRGWGQTSNLGNGPLHRSMEMVHGNSNGRNSPGLMGRIPEDGRGNLDGHRSPYSHSSGSSEGLSRSTSDQTRLIGSSGVTVSRRSTIGSTSNHAPNQPYHPPNIGPGRSPQLPARFQNHHHDNRQNMTGTPLHNPQNDVLEHQVSSMGHSSLQSSTREPNLNDVIDYLSSSNPANVINAASYLQHLAYGDDSMKSKIRQYGGIPSLISQLRSHEGNIQVQTAILGALRNLSYGRINVENKKQIASDAGLPELGLVLKTTRHSEVKELVTSVLWNLSSCDDIKLRILQVCLKDLVQFVILPHSGYSYNSLAAKDFTVRPSVFQWSPEMRNTLGALRNISSAGEDTRKILRVCPHLVDSLMWIVRAATGQEDTDEKTAENAMCILRNLSYRLEYEVDLLDGSQDHLDEDWERQILSEIDDSKQEEKDDQPKGRSSGFLSICARPRTADNLRRSVPRLSQPSNLISPDPSLIPRRVHAVTGVSLLWQPEVIFPYLALLEKFTSTPELIEAAAGAVQNLTACAWKWSVFIRHLVRKTRGLTLLIELLNHSHDTVVRAAATALRNLAVDYPNKRMIGIYGIQNIIPRLPYGQNSLGISEQTTIALLCALMELTLRNSENARVFRENSGIGMIVKLTRSKDHTPRIIYAAHKLCSILHDLKITKPGLKQEGWDIKEYQRLSADTNNTHHLEFERGSFANTELRRSGRGGSVNEGSSKDKKGRKKSSEDISATTTTTAVPQPTLGERRGSQPTMLDLSATNRSGGGGLASTSGSFPKLSNTTTVIADTVEPGYQMIDIAKQPKPSTNQNHQQAPPIPPAPQPIGMYAEINDPGLASLRRGSDSTQPAPPRSDSRTHSHSDHSQPRSEPRSSPIEHHTTTGSTSDEDKPGTALYAQVDMEKKRASRKQKQQGSNVYREEIVIRGQQPPPTHPVTQADDSWV